MAVDRGELRYNIRVTTGNSFRSLRSFRTGLAEAREEFREFRQEMRRGGTDAAVAARGIRRVGDALGDVGRDNTARQALAQQVRDARAVRRALGRVVSELVQVRRQLRGTRTDSERAGRSLQRTGQRAETAGRRGASGFRRLRGEVRATQSSADRLTGSFLRMGGIISTFIIARSVIDGIRTLIETSIQFNRTVERAELGIAAVLTAVGEVRGAFGEAVGQAQQLTLAQAEARRQTVLLRRDALQTAATFEQLLDTFQVALAPGLAAGLDVDEIRGFAVRVSQAALALGVAQNQLSEEIRSILSGTIRPQTTRLAVALGITNEDIRRVRELGQLGEFLEERFSAFGAAGEKALETVDGLVGRVTDGFGQLVGEAGASIGFFDDVKDTLRDVLNLFLEFDEFGFPTPDPQTLRVLQEFFIAIREGLDLLREEFSDITFEEAVAQARLLAETLTVGLQVALGAIQGLSDGFTFLGEVVRGVADALGFDAETASVRQITRALVSVLVVLVSIRAAFGVIGGVIGPIVTSVGLLVLGFRSLAPLVRALLPSLASLRALVLSIGLLAGRLQFGFAQLPPIIQRTAARMRTLLALMSRLALRLTIVLGALNILIRAFTGIELSFRETINVIFFSFQELFQRIRFGGELAFQGLANLILEIFDALGSAIVRNLAGTFAAVVGGLGAIAQELGIISAETREELEKLLFTADRIAAGGRLIEFRFDIAETVREQEAALTEIDRKFEEIARKAQERKDAEEDARLEMEFQLDAAERLANAITTVDDEAETLLQTIERITAQFSTARTAVQSVQDATDRLREALETLDFEEQFRVDANLTGIAQQVNNANLREQVQLARELVSITREREDVERRLAASSRARESSQRALLTFSQQEQAVFSAIDDTIIQIVELRRQEEALVSQAAVARAEERAALQTASREELDAARARRTALEEQLDATRKQREELAAQVNQVQEAGLLSEEALTFLQQRLAVLSEEASLTEDLRVIQETINQLQADSLDLQRRRSEELAQRGLAQAQAEVAQLQIQASLLQDINRLESGTNATGAAIRLATFRSQSAELRVQAALQREQQLRNAQSLVQDIERLRANGGATDALQAQLDALLAQINAQAQLQAAEEERRLREEERLRILQEGTASEAVRIGTEDFIESIGTIQEQLAELTTGLLESLSSGLSSALVNSIVNAFDESGAFVGERFLANLQEAAGRLLQQIATQLLQVVVDNLISTLLSAFLTSSTATVTAATTAATIEQTSAQSAAATKVTAATLAADIEIAAAQTAALIRSSGAFGGISTGGLVPQGFDGGGNVLGGPLHTASPPPGIAKSDTVPAWLTPGEFVHRVSAVRHYGLDVMRALNRRLIDPKLLKAMAGVRSMHSFRTQSQRGPGFQQGGVVSENIRQVANNLENQVGEQIASDVPATVAVPVDENSLETQLGAGREAFRRFLRDNAHDFDGILRSGRTGG